MVKYNRNNTIYYIVLYYNEITSKGDIYMKNYHKKNIILLVILLVLTFSMIFISLLFPENIIVNDSFDHGSGYWSN